MKKEAKYEARCHACGEPINPGEQMDYMPPAGEFEAEYRHVECPAPKPKKVKGVNHVQRQDPELVRFIERGCDDCGSRWFVDRTSLASRRRPFIGHCCDGRHPGTRGEDGSIISLTHPAARTPLERRLKAAA